MQLVSVIVPCCFYANLPEGVLPRCILIFQKLSFSGRPLYDSHFAIWPNMAATPLEEEKRERERGHNKPSYKARAT